jgi:hypothetical protein
MVCIAVLQRIHHWVPRERRGQARMRAGEPERVRAKTAGGLSERRRLDAQAERGPCPASGDRQASEEQRITARW